MKAKYSEAPPLSSCVASGKLLLFASFSPSFKWEENQPSFQSCGDNTFSACLRESLQGRTQLWKLEEPIPPGEVTSAFPEGGGNCQRGRDL